MRQAWNREVSDRSGQKRSLNIAVWLAIFLLCATVFGSAWEVCAAESGEDAWVKDEAGLLTDEETASLKEMCLDIYDQYAVMAVIVTVDDFGGGNIESWESNLYESWGYAQDDACIMLAVSMAERDWGIQTFGYAREAFTTYGRERIAELMLPQLSDGDYYGAFSTYLELVDTFLHEAATEEAFSDDHTYQESVSPVWIVLGAFVISLVISLLIVLSWKKSMNTRIRQESAAEYLVRDSVDVREREDLFLYRNLHRTRRQKDTGSRSNMKSSSSGTHGKF